MVKHKSPEYEFFGVPGVLVLSFFLPLLCYILAFSCNDISGCPAPSLLHPSTSTLDDIKKDVGWPGWSGLINTKAALATLGYYAFSFFLWVALPAEEVQGTVLRNGKRIKYRFNAFQSAITTLAIAAAITLIQGPNTRLWSFIWDNYISLLTCNIIISYSLATLVYIQSYQVNSSNSTTSHRLLAPGGLTGNVLYDWFIGRELNPPITLPFIGTVDIKSFMEMRPGMLGWLVLDLAFLFRQYHNYGYITDSMIIATFSQAVYIFDALYNEPAILTTMDIIQDGFGFMLAFGDLVWVPFTYSLQTRYLAVHPVRLGVLGCAGIFAVQGIGYYIFRASNNEKNRFRTNPEDPRVKHLKYITTASGSKLLVSGWWGTARHINYLGDWLMSWSYCLPTALAGYIIRPTSPFAFHDVRGTAPEGGAFIRNDRSLRGGVEVVPGEAKGWGMLITYFYMAYFAVLLVHRELRDEEKCRKKYGKDWEEYCRRVRWKIIPGIY